MSHEYSAIAARIAKETEEFLKKGGAIQTLESGIVTPASQKNEATKQTAREKGMAKFNGGIAR